MSRSLVPHQADIVRVIKAAKAAGEQVSNVTVTTIIKVEIGKDGKSEPSKEKQDSEGGWDNAINSVEARK